MFDGNSRVQAAAANTGGLKRGSSVQSPDTLASDRDLDKICEATVIGAIVNVGRNRQPPRRHSRASSRLPLASHSFSLSQQPRKTPTTRLPTAFQDPLLVHSYFGARWHLKPNIYLGLTRCSSTSTSPYLIDCHSAHWSCLQQSLLPSNNLPPLLLNITTCPTALHNLPPSATRGRRVLAMSTSTTTLRTPSPTPVFPLKLPPQGPKRPDLE